MPSLSSLEFLIIEAFSGISRNRLMAAAAVFTAGVSLAISAGFAITALSVHSACQKLPQQFDMAVYAKRGTPAARLSALKKSLKTTPYVGSVTYISKEQGWRDFKKSLGAEINTEDVLYNPALDSYRITIAKPEFAQQVQEKIRRMPGVESVLWRQNEVAFFTGLARVVGAAGAATTLVLFLGSIFIIGNTIRLGIYARRREVAIMRLVGARPLFIRLPFLLEGMALAGAGAAFAAIIIRLAASYLSSLTGGIRTITRFLDSGISSMQITMALIAVGLALGGISSVLALQRYMRENAPESIRR